MKFIILVFINLFETYYVAKVSKYYIAPLLTPMQAAENCEIDVECGGFSFSMGGMNTDLPMEDGVLYYRYIVPIYGSMVRTKE